MIQIKIEKFSKDYFENNRNEVMSKAECNKKKNKLSL
jgi:hypothetical protein